MAVDDFMGRAEAELGTLTREENALAAQEEGVRRKRADVQERIGQLRDSIRIYRELMGLGTEPKAPTVGLFDDIPYGSVTDMAYAIIERSGGPMKVSEIARSLVDAGKLKANGTGKSSNYANVFGILRRDRRFMKVAQGTFGIAETTDSRAATESAPPSAQSPTAAQD